MEDSVMENNYLEVGDTCHCLRCHLDIARKDFITHIEVTCTKKGEEPGFSKDCAKCLTFDMPDNPYFKRTTIEDVKRRAGFLRQWLNEDRIKDPNKMVTTEDILYWLFETKL